MIIQFITKIYFIAGKLQLLTLLYLFTGQVNYLGSSHQCWHVLVVLMFYWWHQTGVYITQYRHNQPCSELINT